MKRGFRFDVTPSPLMPVSSAGRMPNVGTVGRGRGLDLEGEDRAVGRPEVVGRDGLERVRAVALGGEDDRVVALASDVVIPSARAGRLAVRGQEELDGDERVGDADDVRVLDVGDLQAPDESSDGRSRIVGASAGC